jgi:hypothetical protein
LSEHDLCGAAIVTVDTGAQAIVDAGSAGDPVDPIEPVEPEEIVGAELEG